MDVRLGTCESKHNGRPVRQYSCHLNSVSSREEAVLRKKHVLNQAIAALRRSVGLPGRFVTVLKNQTWDTHNHCNPAAHVLRGLRYVQSLGSPLRIS